MGLLTSLGWLLAALALARAGARPWVQGAAAVLAGIAGTTLPDLDLLLPIGHRSALTHSLLPPAILWGLGAKRPVTAGLAIGIALHLAADCFPQAMRGFATVKLPGAGSIGAGASYAWLGMQAAAGTLTGIVLLGRSLPARTAAVVALLLVAVGVGYLHAVDGGWRALSLYVLFGWAAVRRRSTKDAIAR
ncbi:hypothetical protein [Sphingomonas sp. VNH70]|uniref:hypothetical protein n=1 Tax=Sphingomonas silueang TaxID=3156617 RepID=UPI0032B39D73